jgi:hypothetical protein
MILKLEEIKTVPVCSETSDVVAERSSCNTNKETAPEASVEAAAQEP